MEKSIMAINNQNKTRILIVGPGKDQVGGVSTFIEILLTDPFLNEKYDFIHLETTRASRDLGLENRFSLMNLTYLIHQLFQFVMITIRMRPRLVHLQVTSGLAFWKTTVFILIGKILGLKTVAHLHGGMFDQYYKKSKLMQRRTIGWVLQHTDVVIALSEKWRGFLLEEVRPDIHVEIVSNTIDSMFAQVLGLTIEGDIKKEKIILFVGSLGRRKGVFDILQAIHLVCLKHPDARFYFAGNEEKRGEKLDIDQVCQEKQLINHVQFIGMITGPAKLELYRRAMVFILPSYGENLPYSLLEAMAVGLPIVTTSVGAISEIIKDGRNGFLIQPGDYEALANRIVQILDQPALRTNMFQENTEIIRKEFLPNVAIAKFDELYRRLIYSD